MTRSRGRLADHVEPLRHALAAVDEQHEHRRHVFLLDELRHLPHAVLEHREAARLNPADEPPALVPDGSFEQHAEDLRRFGDLERIEHDRVSRGVAEAVRDVDDDLATLERVLIDPFDCVGRAVGDHADELAVDIEIRRLADVGRRLDARDDAEGAGRAGATERRRDPDRERTGGLRRPCCR